jgi:hypothetical protein
MGAREPGRSSTVKARAEDDFFMEAGAKAAAEPRRRAEMATVNCIVEGY